MSIKAPKYAFGDQTKKILVSYVLKGPPRHGALTPSNGKARKQDVVKSVSPEGEQPLMDDTKGIIQRSPPETTTLLKPEIPDGKPQETFDMMDPEELDQALAKDFKREPMPQTYPKQMSELPEPERESEAKPKEQSSESNGTPKKKKAWTKYKDMKFSDNPDNTPQ